MSRMYLVGKISATDNKGVLEVSSHIEKQKSYCDPVVFISITPYGSEGISMKMSNYELRSLSHELLRIYSTGGEFERRSGGKGPLCTLRIKGGETYGEFLLLREGNTVRVSVKLVDIFGFSKEIAALCDATSDALFKTQRMIDNKKAK